MNWMILADLITVFSVLAAVGQSKGWIDLSWNQDRRGGSMTIGDEVFNPTRHEAQLELDRQTMLPAPAPLPSDGHKGAYQGTVHIEL